MQQEFKKQAQEDLEFWKKTDKQKLKKIFKIFESIEKTPFEGIGKPEALKHNLTGCYSRRIDQVHRVVYRAGDGEIIVYQCRYHY